MEQLKELLENCCPDLDWTQDGQFITGGVIDSVDLVAIISDIEDVFGIEVDMEEVVPENFDSLEAMWSMIERLS